ncbi:RNA polymerase factor sigma-32 [Pseudobacteriovorax antillogorgiicola]|uniref:RNA polymerase, sigma 32 subunit, RpoH n=1 Tax=Pseudobacteriovorax antillogorgiicola TaxID=1513793 RepID=A0A1Y6B5I9_9BACT|nr:RNA polymerase factor sigma-32 [Pseudobacteriovorax antillogorgiicola]TCS59177.1 RNA polymerase RpoH-like sigma 32 subunit [Pseudobacteriovorax antillogorgiicola]SME90863.1 RNA polymerase, sigma 32 subunit, RpoH [Pseudobacteriovorax antillogorgiicola]
MSQKLPAKQSGGVPAKMSPLQLYLQEIAKYPLLSPEEEFETARQHFEDGDITAAHRLVTSNLRLVVKIANDFRQAQVNLLDLIQEGNYGLMQAVKKYNPYKGVKLSSYAAWWIRAFILKHIMDNKSQVKIGTTAAQRKLFFNLKKEADRLLAEYDRIDTKLLAENLNVKEKDVIEMQMRLSAPDYSLDAPIQKDGGESVSRGSMIPTQEESAEDQLAELEVIDLFAEHLEEFKDTLKDRDLEIFEDRIISENPLTLQEIGDRYGVSRERARQLEVKIIKNLRQFVKDKGVIDVDLGD